MNATAAAGSETSFWTPRILFSFLLLVLIWGSTWIVIKDQIANVPPVWSVCYRFLAASTAMFVIVMLRGQRVMLPMRGHFWAILIGLCQFAINFNLVYRAEAYITSGLVAVLFALLMVPNAILGRVLLGQPIKPGFVIGSAIAIAGIAMLFVQEYRMAPVGGDAVYIGVGLAFIAIFVVSIANIAQAREGAKVYPILILLAWAMAWGTLANAVFAVAVAGPPAIDPRPAYFAGILYLGVIGSAVTFPIYFGLIREIGAAQAAYSGVLIPIVAMVISTIFEGYHWSPLALGGAAFAVVGLVLAMQVRRPKMLRPPG
jgi:drug/metabolite transporter (DMT)-like permease